MVTSAITVEGVRVPASATSLEGFRAWTRTLDEHGPRVCFWNGEVYVEVSPQSNRTHGPILTEINRVLANVTLELDLGTWYMPPTWFTDEKSGLSTEPDGALVLHESFAKGRVVIEPEREVEMVGAPDLALEVVSRTSVRKDYETLVRGYAKAGVREYWTADGRDAELRFSVRRLARGRYVEMPRDRSGWIESPLFGRAFRLVRFVNRAGNAAFRLEVRGSRSTR